MNVEILKLNEIHCGYGTRPVLNGVSLSLSEGETVLLAGPNGCGKSTLLKSVIGELPLTAGTIVFGGKELHHESVERRIHAGIGYLRQSGNIFPGLTVKENLELSGLAMSKKDFTENIDRMLSVFDFLKEHLSKRAGALSGGQRQALAIAMVLMHPRKLYLLDEPTAGLSPKAAVDIMERVHHFVTMDEQQTVLMVEHRLELLDWVNRAVVLIQGKIKAETDNTKMFLDPQWLSQHYF